MYESELADLTILEDLSEYSARYSEDEDDELDIEDEETVEEKNVATEDRYAESVEPPTTSYARLVTPSGFSAPNALSLSVPSEEVGVIIEENDNQLNEG